METPQEFAEGQVRRFMTVLFVARAKRHLKSLSELYEWTPEQLADYETRFIKPAAFIPQFIRHSSVVDS